jgi:hypothetical protein
MLIVSCYNVFGNAYYAAFGVPVETYDIIIDNVVEFLFLCDMIFCFFQEYLDEETYKMVDSFKLIAVHYAKKSFMFDFCAWFPVELFLDQTEMRKRRLFRVLRLLRLPRLAQLLDIEKFKSTLKDYF